MNLEKELAKRSNSCCELCGASESLTCYTIPPATTASLKDSIYICNTCISQIQEPETMNPDHWRCLNDSMWSEVLGVQVMAWRLLHRLRAEGWPQDLLDMMYLNEEDLAFAKVGIKDESILVHKDSNGNILEQGDSVVLIKDLDVKGSSLTAKRGTAVRNIRLDHENAEYIEGKVDGQQIVILTKYGRRKEK